jgi:hypothetical protein
MSSLRGSYIQEAIFVLSYFQITTKRRQGRYKKSNNNDKKFALVHKVHPLNNPNFDTVKLSVSLNKQQNTQG